MAQIVSNESIGDDVVGGFAQSPISAFFADAFDGISVGASLSGLTTYHVVLSAGMDVGSASGGGRRAEDIAISGVGVASGATPASHGAAFDGVAFVDDFGWVLPIQGVCISRVNVVDFDTDFGFRAGGIAVDVLGVSPSIHTGVHVLTLDQLRLASVPTSNFVVGLMAGDAFKVKAATRVALPAAAVAAIGVDAVVSAAVAVTVADELGLTAALAGASRRFVAATTSLHMHDVAARFFGALAVDEVALGSSAGSAARAVALIADAIEIAPSAPAPTLTIRVIAHERIEVTALEAIRMIYDTQAVAGVEFAIGYLSSGGDFSAWAMNTRNGAVTEYTNFEFNSFARVGNIYLGASSSGLYELRGDTDDGADILATLRGGYMQFGGPRLSRLSAAYISIGSPEGEVYLRVMSKDGDTYLYRVDTRAGRNTKVHMGKGMRARYFAYELTTVGQDFDLDTLEFVPVVVNRRV